MASLQGSVEQNCEKLVCSICLSLFRDPRILPCIHTFCKTCLLSHIDATKKYNSFECPLCRDDIQLPKNGIDGVKKNIYIVDEINTLSEKIRTQSLCHTHPVEDLKLFCVTCGVRICRDCKFENHDEHKSRLITDLVDERIHTLKSKLQATEKEASGAIGVLASLKSKHDKIVNGTDACVARLMDHVRQLHMAIDDLTRDTIQQLNGQKNNAVVKLNEDIKRLNDYIATFSSTEKSVSKLISGKEESVAEILSAYDTLVDTLDKLQVHNTASGSGVDVTHMDFYKGKIDKDMLKNMIGTVSHALLTVADGNETKMLTTCAARGNINISLADEVMDIDEWLAGRYGRLEDTCGTTNKPVDVEQVKGRLAGSGEKLKYDRDFLLRFQHTSTSALPPGFPDIPDSILTTGRRSLLVEQTDAKSKPPWYSVPNRGPASRPGKARPPSLPSNWPRQNTAPPPPAQLSNRPHRNTVPPVQRPPIRTQNSMIHSGLPRPFSESFDDENYWRK